jgi:hypothetical protein
MTQPGAEGWPAHGPSPEIDSRAADRGPRSPSRGRDPRQPRPQLPCREKHDFQAYGGMRAQAREGPQRVRRWRISTRLALVFTAYGEGKKINWVGRGPTPASAVTSSAPFSPWSCARSSSTGSTRHCRLEWQRIIEDLADLREIEVEQDGRRARLRTAPGPTIDPICRGIGLSLPQVFQEVPPAARPQKGGA